MLEFKNQARTNDVKEISSTTDTTKKKKKEKTEQGVKRIKWEKKSGSNRKKLTATRKAGF